MTFSDDDNSGLRQYESLVDGLLLKSVGRGEADFDQLLRSLPGVYPATVLSRLAHLASTSQLDELRYRRIVSDSHRNPLGNDHQCGIRHQIQLPIEHPLDYEWRFSQESAVTLLNRATSLSMPGKPIAMLGTPTILRYALETEYSGTAVLVDRNPLVKKCFAKYQKATVHRCDVLKDSLPDVEASVVIVDPPWYGDYMMAFAWAATLLSGPRSYLLMSAPPVGTRPNVESEMNQLLSWMEQELSVTLLQIDQGALPYRTPLFEGNALRAAGVINVPAEWRRGDLWVLKSGGARSNLVSRPSTSDGPPCWQEAMLCNVRVKLKGLERYSPSFSDPSLKPLVKNDVLPSVSRRDPRRNAVEVWTSGNRIFTSANTKLLHAIIHALTFGGSPHDQVAEYVERELTSIEASLVSTTVDQLRQLEITERDEAEMFWRGNYRC